MMNLVCVCKGFLHIRGGVSFMGQQDNPGDSFSPHTWRCFSFVEHGYIIGLVFSTYVEVFLFCGNQRPTDIGFSPHTWRCFLIAQHFPRQLKVFSTYVEVFLIQVMQRSSSSCFLHVCGGVSRAKTPPKTVCRFSPRMWRCFLECARHSRRNYVFSTYVEVFLELPF